MSYYSLFPMNCETTYVHFINPKILWIYFFFFFCLFAISWAALAAYEGSQARGGIRATATQDLSPICSLHHSSQQHQILNPLGKARDRTRNPMVASQVH